MKGHEESAKPPKLLRPINLPQLNYTGFVEADGIGKARLM